MTEINSSSLADDDTNVTILDKLPCGKVLVLKNGVEYIVLEDSLPLNKVVHLFEHDSYCEICKEIAATQEVLDNPKTLKKEKVKQTPHLKELLEVVPSPPTPKDDCHSYIRKATSDMFVPKHGKPIKEDADTVHNICKAIAKYGFPQVVLLLSFYANQSDLTVEWLNLVMHESIEQSGRMKIVKPGEENPVETIVDRIRKNVFTSSEVVGAPEHMYQ